MTQFITDIILFIVVVIMTIIWSILGHFIYISFLQGFFEDKDSK